MSMKSRSESWIWSTHTSGERTAAHLDRVLRRADTGRADRLRRLQHGVTGEPLHDRRTNELPEVTELAGLVAIHVLADAAREHERRERPALVDRLCEPQVVV